MLLVKLSELKNLNKKIILWLGVSAYLMCPTLAFSFEESVQVGKHANTNMDASAMLLSLLMVLALIVVSAFVLKKFQLTTRSVSGMKVITSLSLSPKERLVVVEVQGEQLLLGVSGQQITLLKTLDKPLTPDAAVANDLGKSLLNLVNKTSKNNDAN